MMKGGLGDESPLFLFAIEDPAVVIFNRGPDALKTEQAYSLPSQKLIELRA
jgi:hypothetical protein